MFLILRFNSITTYKAYSLVLPRLMYLRQPLTKTATACTSLLSHIHSLNKISFCCPPFSEGKGGYNSYRIPMSITFFHFFILFFILFCVIPVTEHFF